MKNACGIALAVLLGLVLAGNALADDATKDECIAKTKEAAQMIVDQGQDAAVAELNKKDGKFVWKNTYVFLVDFDGKMVANPMSPGLVGKSVIDMKDKGTEGKFLIKEFIEVAKTKGEGWVDYMWPKPGEQTPSKKNSFIYRVPGKDLLVGAGIYE